MNKLRGSVTIFAALIFSVVIGLFVTIIESARIQGARVMVSMAGSLALDTLFAGFERALLDEYGVLLFDGGNGGETLDYSYLEKRLSEGITYNLNGDEGMLFVDSTDFYDINIDSIEVADVVTADERCGLIWRTMINDYAKVDYSVTLMEEILQIETINEQSESVNRVVDSVSTCYDSVGTISSKYLRLIELIDGIKCGSTGINYDKLNTTSVFVKKLCPMEVFDPVMDVISISDSRIYNAVRGEIFDVNQFFEDVLAEYEYCFSVDDVMLEDLILKLEIIKNFLLNELGTINEAMNTINAIRAANSELPGQIMEAANVLQSMAGGIDITFYESLYNDINGLEADRILWEEKSASLDGIYNVLADNYSVIVAAYELCPDVSGWRDNLANVHLEYKKYYELYVQVAEKIKEYRTDGMYLDYTGLEAQKTAADGSVLDIIYSYAKDGILGLVIPKDSELSTKEIGFNNLASDYAIRGNRSLIINSAANDIANEMLFNVYIYDMFSNFVDNSGNGVLDYELEYILFGRSKDKDNLFNAVAAIAGIRLGCNLMSIYTDAERKAQAASLATSLIGFVGIPLLVKGLEYTILTAWAIGETVVDIKCLLAGGKVPLIKDKGDWQLSLDNLTSFNLTASDEKSDKGLGYAEYLCGILLIMNGQDKAYRSMDIVELNMMGMGIEGFRFKNYIYGMEIKIIYHMGSSKKQYTEYCVYTY